VLLVVEDAIVVVVVVVVLLLLRSLVAVVEAMTSLPLRHGPNTTTASSPLATTLTSV